MSHRVETVIKRLEGAQAMALRGATQGEKDAGVQATVRLCKSVAASEPDAIGRCRSVTDRLIRLLPPDQAARLQVSLSEISLAFAGPPAPDTAFSGSSQPKSQQETEPTVADLLRRRGYVRRPPRPERAEPPRHLFRVDRWVYNLLTRQAAIIEERVSPRNGPNGPEDIFLMDAVAGGRRDWYQFEIRLATPEEIEAEQANRKAKQERTERERAEWWARLKARRETRASCNLFAIARKQRRKSEMLVGRAWDGGEYVVFEAVDGTIRSQQTFSSKGAATRAYNTAIATGYTKLDADEERFDRLCPALVVARLARAKKRAGG